MGEGYCAVVTASEGGILCCCDTVLYYYFLIFVVIYRTLASQVRTYMLPIYCSVYDACVDEFPYSHRALKLNCILFRKIAQSVYH